MHARIGVWTGNAEELERWIARSRNEVRPAVQAAGAVGAYWLVDRAGGKALTVTLWTSEEAMRKSEQRAAALQSGTASASGARVTTERYEIVEQFHA